MAKLETEITVNVRDLPEVQQTLNECRELRDAAQEYMRTCPADPDTTPAFYAAHERLRAAIAALTPADGVPVVVATNPSRDQGPCTVCGKLWRDHGTYPVYEDHHYTPADGVLGTLEASRDGR